VPSGADEDRRQLHRALVTTKRDRTRVINRIKGRRAGDGLCRALQGDVAPELEEVRRWDGPPLPAALRARLKRAWQKVPPLTEQIGSLEAERRAGLRPSEERVMEPVRQ
jgi:transposase